MQAAEAHSKLEKKKDHPQQRPGAVMQPMFLLGHPARHPGLGLSISTLTTSTAVQPP